MEYSRWLQYVHYFFPEITLVRPKEDECDGCYAINIELSNLIWQQKEQNPHSRCHRPKKSNAGVYENFHSEQRSISHYSWCFVAWFVGGRWRRCRSWSWWYRRWNNSEGEQIYPNPYSSRRGLWCKMALKLKNVWHPKQLVKLVNGVKNLQAEFLDHNAPNPPFFIGWEAVLDKYFVDLPGVTQAISFLSSKKEFWLQGTW